jgi:hypothetical protein
MRIIIIIIIIIIITIIIITMIIITIIIMNLFHDKSINFQNYFNQLKIHYIIY